MKYKYRFVGWDKLVVKDLTTYWLLCLFMKLFQLPYKGDILFDGNNHALDLQIVRK